MTDERQDMGTSDYRPEKGIAVGLTIITVCMLIVVAFIFWLGGLSFWHCHTNNQPKVYSPHAWDEYQANVRHAEDVMFITRSPQAGKVLECEEWVSKKHHTRGFYNCDWVDPKPGRIYNSRFIH